MTLCNRVKSQQSVMLTQKKKLKGKAVARGVNREDVKQGCEELGVPLDEHITFVLEALRPHERVFGLGPP